MPIVCLDCGLSDPSDLRRSLLLFCFVIELSQNKTEKRLSSSKCNQSILEVDIHIMMAFDVFSTLSFHSKQLRSMRIWTKRTTSWRTSKTTIPRSPSRPSWRLNIRTSLRRGDKHGRISSICLSALICVCVCLCYTTWFRLISEPMQFPCLG